ncbi:monovalent cation:H+ antiporter-2, CPA2 family [Nannocystis exedens]|uniref:Monovalent cation:H+ antiporter-2, CPA2 family n=1 Tax=Nannocystis exedens TaxID=54 RepID=A0A1I2FR09_9BACT|nr:YbaL family putative K(+) efflux transporter [Nannocystis exedens]PCC74508.1 cation:proton antiport protein [Nannocystis exedens]SFF06911.1 monovalent cation:H+ antiporter-2, CPA2 family [Nannocystis exedens]
MLHHTPLLDTIAAGLVAAFALGALATRARLSPLVGYLAAGIVVGPHTPGIVADTALANELSEIGVILLMFGVGLHFSLRDLLDVKSIAVPGAVVQIAIATGLGAGLGWLLGWSASAGLMFGLALSVASTVVLLRALEERRLLDSPRGKIAIGWLIVEDLATVLALVLVPAIAGGEGGDPWLALVLTLVKVAGFLALMLVVGRRAIPWMLEQIAGTGSRELFTLCVLAIALGVALGAALLFNVSLALGAFFAGMLLTESEFSHKAASDSLPLRDAFAVLFFVSVGMLFDPRILVDQPLLVLATCGIIIIGKSLAALALVLAFRRPFATALTISVSLAQIGEFSFILAGLGVELDLMPTEARDLILAGAILTILCNPLLFVALDRWQRRRDRVEAEERAVVASGPPAPEGPFVLLIGYGRVGRAIAQILRERGTPLLVVDTDPDLVDRARARGIPAICGNAANPRVLAETRPAQVRLAMLAIPQALEAGEVVARLREAKPDMTIIARGHSEAEVEHLLRHGADGAVMAERIMALRMAEMAAHSLAYQDKTAATAVVPATKEQPPAP